MGGSTFWLATRRPLVLVWGVGYFVFHGRWRLIHLLLVFALMSFIFPRSIGKAE